MNGTETATAPAPRTRTRKPPVKLNNKLSTAERGQLRKFEGQIQRHFETFQTAGSALLAIRDQRLYRETHATFEDYSREKWEMSKTQANRLIAAAKVVENVASVVSPDIAAHLTESVIRPLTNLPPEAQKKAMAQAVESAPSTRGLTAKVVNAAAHAVSPKSFRAKKPGRTTNGGGDLIRRTELLDEINAWEKKHRADKSFERLTPVQVVRAVRTIIQGL